jgi:hypothetical protein
VEEVEESQGFRKELLQEVSKESDSPLEDADESHGVVVDASGVIVVAEGVVVGITHCSILAVSSCPSPSHPVPSTKHDGSQL